MLLAYLINKVLMSCYIMVRFFCLVALVRLNEESANGSIDANILIALYTQSDVECEVV